MVGYSFYQAALHYLPSGFALYNVEATTCYDPKMGESAKRAYLVRRLSGDWQGDALFADCRTPEDPKAR